MTTLPLKRFFESASGGSWGVEPEEGEIVARCIRGTDFDYPALRVQADSAPARGFTQREFRMRSLRPGDLVVEKSGGGEQQPVGRVVLFDHDFSAVPTNFAGRLRTAVNVDARFACYLLASLYADGRTRAAIKQTTGIQNLDLEALLSQRVWQPSPGQQRAIADFLDAETARIDALIVKKRRLIELLDEWEQRSVLEDVGDWSKVPTRNLRQYGVTVFTGPFGTVLSADEYVEGGVPLINPTHIKRGSLVPEEGVSVPESVARRISRHRLRQGDIVMGRKGDVGRSAIVPAEADGWLCGSDSIAIRCPPRSLRADYLVTALGVSLYRQQLARHSTGATLANINEQVLLALRVPDLTLDQQQVATAQGAAVAQDYDRLVSRLDRQIGLLVEHRQALITAAVTGELAVPGVAA